MPVPPSWLAARAGLPADSTAVNHAAQISQFLGSHGVTVLCEGVQLVTPGGNPGIQQVNLGEYAVDQPFTMPAGDTVTGRLTLPLSPAGDGADVLVSLYTDSGGSPGTLVASVRVPASWLAQLAAAGGLDSTGLATAASNTLLLGALTPVAWPQPASGGTYGGVYPALAVSGNYLIMAGGFAPAGGAPVAAVTTVQYLGGTSLGPPVPQPALPQATSSGGFAATPDTLVYAGGDNGESGSPVAYTNVWTAPWDPSTGTVSAWSAQQALPAAVSFYNAAAAWGETVYLIGGQTSAGTTLATVYYATVNNGQITVWNTGPSLPKPVSQPAVGVVGNWLIVAGGLNSSADNVAATWYTAINSDGSLRPWQADPALPAGEGGTSLPWMVTSSGMLVPSLLTLQVLTVTDDGPAPAWQSTTNLDFGNWPAAAFPAGDGQWQTFANIENTYYTGVLNSVPYISVPLPVTGLTGGGAYHIVLQQDGGDLNDYVQVALLPDALPATAQTRPAGGSTWTPVANSYSVYAGVWDQTPGGNVLHLWEDSGTRVSTLVWAGGSSQLLGVAEATQFADGTLLADVAQVTWSGSAPGSVPTGVVQLA